MLSSKTNKSSIEVEKYYALDSLRKEIIETKRKTVFFDEFKFRRRLSDVYFSLILGIEPFSPSRIGAINVLEDEFIKIEKTFYGLMK
jgi:hypothetical protein